MRTIKNPSIINECIKEIGEMALVQAEAGDEEGVMKSIDALMSLVPKATKDPIAQMSPEELNTKIDHILGWVKPLIERLGKKNE